MIRVRQIEVDSRRDVRQFVRLPFRLYRDNTRWVPPLLTDARRVLDRASHPSYEHTEAAFFVAERGAETIGRLAAMEKARYNEYQNSGTCFFGYFDCIDDAGTARLLFDAAAAWARARGLAEMRGPTELIGAMGGGVLTCGFEHRPAIAMPYNYPYYDDLLRGCGFEKVTDYLSGYLSGDHELPERFYRIARKVRARFGFALKSFESMEDIRQWIPAILTAHGQAFAGSNNYYPPSEAEALVIARTLMSVAIPELPKLVLKDDRVVGFILCYPDISAGLQRARGRMWPLGWYHLLRDRARTEWANVNGLGVVPEYQGRGASILLYTELAHSLKEHGFRHVDVVQVDEANVKSRSDMEAIGVRWYKRHRSYVQHL